MRTRLKRHWLEATKLSTESKTRLRPILFGGDLLPLRPVLLPMEWRESQVVANLECAITSETVRSVKAHNVVLPPSAADHLAAMNLAALSVANNHTLDAGSAGLTETLALLRDKVSTQVYGTNETPFAVLDSNGHRCAIVGCLEKCRSRGDRLFAEERVSGLLREITDQYSAVFVTPHWGKEGEFACYPSPRQVRLARQWIDAGAAGVFGHHPHVLHGCNSFRSRPVYYSLGNLWFQHEESARYPASRLGLAVRVDMCNGEASYTDHYIVGSASGVDIYPDLDEELSICLNRLSEPLVTGAWTTWRWARSVGGVYIDKSARSWSQRLSGTEIWKSRGLYLIWSLMPSTLLMRLGRCFASTEAAAIADKLANAANGVSEDGAFSGE